MPAGWSKSSYSGGSTDNCVEVRITSTTVGIRDSKNADGDVIDITPAAWTTFLTGLTKA